MKIREKLFGGKEVLLNDGPITIVAFGDSVTHGGLGSNEISYETVYWNLLKKRLNAKNSYMPVNVINAGIGGITAERSLARMERQVFAHNPDLIIVSFGLNDVNGPLENYISALRTIFTECTSRGIDTIFLTPNMLNTYVAKGTSEQYLNYAAVTAEYQNSGRMDTYVAAAVKLAKECGVAVADAYSRWKELSRTTDTTLLLANFINHPRAEMHELFADELYRIIFPDDLPRVEKIESTMYS